LVRAGTRVGGGTKGSGSGTRESAVFSTVGGSVTLFILILDTITTESSSAGSSASVGCEVRVEWSVVALLITFDNSVTTNGGHLEELDVSAISWL